MNKKLLKRIFSYLKKDLFLLVISFILTIFSVLCCVYIPIMFGQGIDIILNQNGKEELISLLIKTILLIGINGIIQWFILSISNKVCYGVARRLRAEAFCKIERLPLKLLDSRPVGEFTNIIINDVDEFTNGLILGVSQIINGILTIISIIVILFFINWVISLALIILTPLSLFISRFVSRNTYNLFKEQSIIKAEQVGLIDETFTYLKIVKANNHEKKSKEAFDEVNDRLSKVGLKALFFSSLVNPSTRFINAVIYAVICMLASIFIVKFKDDPNNVLYLTVGSLSTLLSYVNQYTKPFNDISSILAEIQNSFACASRVFELLNLEEESDDSTLDELVNVQGNIDINHLYFHYNESKPLITDFNLHIKEGMKVAIVGPTGCGKTTLVNLLMRFYDPISGEIRIDNQNIQDVKRKSLRTSFGMVLQTTWIRNASVKENIMMGKTNASLEEVIAASKKAHCHNFISKLPQGYDTIIGEDGNLSIGEKQLIQIARIMLLEPRMLILDEATSSIDTRTEQLIQDGFNELMEGKTSFIVAHRLQTIKNADLILVMNQGNVIEQGNHEELMKKNGFYTKLYESQFSK